MDTETQTPGSRDGLECGPETTGDRSRVAHTATHARGGVGRANMVATSKVTSARERERAPAYAAPSEKERESIRSLRQWLRRDGLRVPAIMTHESIGGEERALLRYVRARKTAEKSYEMLKNTLKWREEHAVDECLREPIDDDKLVHVAKIPAYYAGFGKTGHPIYLEHTAAVPWGDILANMKDDEFLKSQVQTLEWQAEVVYPEASYRAGEPITQVINVWDLKGLTMSGFTSDVRALVKKGSALAQDNYPEGLYAAYIVNAPRIFSFIWAIVKQFLDAKTVSKVHIYGSGTKMWEKLMDKLGDSTTLTKDMVCCDKKDIGKAEAKKGLIPAHGATQIWIKNQIDGVESSLGAAPGVLRRESSVRDMYDVFFDAQEELPSPVGKDLERFTTMRTEFEVDGLSANQPDANDTVEAVEPTKKCCAC